MSTKKRLLAPLAGAAILAMALGACGAPTQADDAGAPAGEAPADAPRDSEGRTPISITWRGTGDDDSMLAFLQNEFIPMFEAENPDIAIELAPITASEADYFPRLQLALSSPDTAPNVVVQDTFQIGADSAAGLLLALDDKVAEWDDWHDYYVDSLKDGVVGYDGRIYAVPGTSDSRGLWFNRDVLEAAGFSRNWAPRTWDEVMEAAVAIRDTHDDTIPLSFNIATVNGEATTMQAYLMFLHATGEVLFDHDEGKWVIESQGIRDALGFVEQAMCVEQVGPSLPIAMSTTYESTLRERLPQGRAGIFLDGFWNGGFWREGGAFEVENVEDVIGFAPFPTQHGQAGGSVTLAGGLGWSIPANSQHHDLSWRVIQALGSAEMQLARVMHDGNLTVRSDSAADPAYSAVPFIAEATAMLENTFFRPALQEYPQVSTEIRQMMENVGSCQMAPEAAMTEWANSVIRIVGEENTLRR